jgi:hypothetical protein
MWTIAFWRRVGFEDATDHLAIGQRIAVIFVPIAGLAGSRGAL